MMIVTKVVMMMITRTLRIMKMMLMTMFTSIKCSQEERHVCGEPHFLCRIFAFWWDLSQPPLGRALHFISTPMHYISPIGLAQSLPLLLLGKVLLGFAAGANVGFCFAENSLWKIFHPGDSIVLLFQRHHISKYSICSSLYCRGRLAVKLML